MCVIDWSALFTIAKTLIGLPFTTEKSRHSFADFCLNYHFNLIKSCPFFVSVLFHSILHFLF